MDWDYWRWKIVIAIIILVNALTMYMVWRNSTTPHFHDFEDAKWIMEEDVIYDRRITLYCGAAFDQENRINLPGVLLVDGKEAPARQFMSWEHVVPVSFFGAKFPEWTDGAEECVSKGRYYKGRRCAERVNERFRQMEGDMHNLFPAIQAINSVRGNRQFGELPQEEPAFGFCAAKISRRQFEPPDEAKGVVARAALYMDLQYPEAALPPKQKRLLEKWNALFPPQPWECERAKRIEKLQGVGNPFIREPCEAIEKW